jgi:hypothetical protein
MPNFQFTQAVIKNFRSDSLVSVCVLQFAVWNIKRSYSNSPRRIRSVLGIEYVRA